MKENCLNKKNIFLVFMVILIFSKINIAFGDTILLDANVPELTSEGAIVIDANTGQIIYGKNEHKKLMPASTTKVMTALLTIENLKLTDTAVVSENPPNAEGSSMGFLKGEEIVVKDLLYSLLVHSANDAAEILAEAISGSVEEFSVLMNQRAEKLGALNTNFVNPSGLTDENHYTTPYDLSLITQELSKHTEIADMCHTYSYMLPLTNLTTEENRWVANKNALMIENNEYYYEPIILAKTGWTPDANSSHTALAEKDGKKYIVTLMNTKLRDDLWKETLAMFNWAFDEIEVYKIYDKNQEIKTLTLKDGSKAKLNSEEDFYIATSDKAKPQTILEFNEDDLLKDEYKQGDVFTSVKILLNQKEIGKLNLISDTSITSKTDAMDLENPDSELKETNKPKLLVVYPILFLAIVIFVIRIVNKIRYKRKLKDILNKRKQKYGN